MSNRSQAEQVIAALRGQLAHLGKAQENGAQTVAQLQRATRQAAGIGAWLSASTTSSSG